MLYIDKYLVLGIIIDVFCTDRNQPLRPTIELVQDSAGRKMLKRELIHLSENPLLYITESLHERDIS
jgi:hypothetical protein